MSNQFKSVLFILAVVAMFSGCQQGNNDARDAARQEIESANQPNAIQNAVQTPAVPAGPTTSVSFSEERFNFGSVVEGEKVAHTYSFTNTGKEPLILSNARGSCGCTVPKWPREPIQPGESADIVVEFNTQNKQGQRSQKVTITANTNPPESFIYLEGQVQPAASEPNVQVNQ